MKQAEKVGSNSSLHSDTKTTNKKETKTKTKKNKNKKTKKIFQTKKL